MKYILTIIALILITVACNQATNTEAEEPEVEVKEAFYQKASTHAFRDRRPAP